MTKSSKQILNIDLNILQINNDKQLDSLGVQVITADTTRTQTLEQHQLAS